MKLAVEKSTRSRSLKTGGSFRPADRSDSQCAANTTAAPSKTYKSREAGVSQKNRQGKPQRKPGHSETDETRLSPSHEEVEWLDLHQHIPMAELRQGNFQELLKKAARMAAKNQRTNLIVRVHESSAPSVERFLSKLGSHIENYFVLRSWEGQKELKVFLENDNAEKRRRYQAALDRPLNEETRSELMGVLESLAGENSGR